MASSSIAATRVLSRRPGLDVLAVRRARLRVMVGSDRGAELELGERQIALIGTDPEAHLVLHDDSVSRRHAELRAEPDGYVLRDLGSTNGVRIGGVLIREALLDGATPTISLGDTDLQFQLENDEVQHELSAANRFGLVIGSAPCMRQMFAILERASTTDSTVLLEGESGTGKEVIAESIHRASPRADGPFVVVDCSAIPANLIETELFGHEKGAFTGAAAKRSGAIEEANGGTLFLDEVGELPLDLQPKFLRALERRHIKRVGATAYQDVDVRVIAATNRDLARCVAESTFRSDLFYRLAVVRVVVPALRHHPEDIPVLARHFATQIRRGVDPDSILTRAMLAAFASYAWPGNVRELRNAVERIAALGEFAQPPGKDATEPEQASVAATEARARGSYHQERREALDRFEADYCKALLDECEGVVLRAAERAGISRQMFHRLLTKHDISK